MADDEQFSLCWNNFNTNLSAGFHESLCRGDLVDVTLAAEGQLVKAHRLVLSVCSPYFRKMFTQMPANQHAFVFLKDVSHSALKDLIQFMYCGEVNVKQEALPAFISTAEALQIKGLTDSDPPASQTPPEPSTPTQQTQQVASPRMSQQRQRTSTSRSYKIETVEDTVEDKTPSTQIVIQTTSAAPPIATIVHHQPTPQLQHHHQSPQIQTVSSVAPSTVATTSAATLVQSSSKRSAQRSSVGSTGPHTKRTKSTIDPLESAETATTTANTQIQPQQITVQSAVVTTDNSKIQQARQQTSAETEYIDLPTIELPTKSEPEYTEDTGEVVTGDQDTSYVEDDAYGDMRYDESYFTENEDGAPAVSAANASGTVAASTSKALIKQQTSQSFSDSSYVDPADGANSEAQALLRTIPIPRKRGRPKQKTDNVPQIKLIDKLIEATRACNGQPAVYASTTKGGMKLVYEGHHFKFSFRKGQYSVFQCCYKENREECKVRVVCDQKRVFPLDGDHVHFVQATDKSVTSEQFVPGEEEHVPAEQETVGDDTFIVLEDLKVLDESTGDPPVALTVTNDNDTSDQQELGLNEDGAADGSFTNETGAEASDFREKIKRRLQKALQGKKK